MRKLIAGMKMSLDGKIEAPEVGADWVEAALRHHRVSSRTRAAPRDQLPGGKLSLVYDIG